MKRIIMHLDVNNAFLSWTAVYMLKNGAKYDIRNSYAVIGGDEKTRNGIVLAKSTPAKKMGVVTGETLYSARKKCKALKTYPMNYPFYQEMSYKFFSLLKKYTPDIEIASIDECYLDYTKVQNLYGDPYEFAKKIQKEVNDTLGFTINIGIANNKLCAKMASDFTKPNKIHTLYDEEVKVKMWPLDVGELFGIGKKSTEKLKQLKINTIYDLAHTNIAYLSRYFKNRASQMINWANGIDESLVISEYVELKGISNEVTLIRDIDDKVKLYPDLYHLSKKVGLRLRKQEKYAYVVAIILKDKYFKRKIHQKKLNNPINLTEDIFEASKKVLNEMWDGTPIRLIGIRLTQLTDNLIYQTSLFENEKEHKEDIKINGIIDKVNSKYGTDTVKKASELLNKRKYK